jgi:cytochrome c-type biogenesis protein CcmH
VTLWIALGLLSLAAIGFLAWPLFRGEKRLTTLLAGVIVFAVALSAGLYQYLGSPGVPSGAGSMPDVSEMVTSLAKRLEENPGDIDGWKMLGRSYQTLNDFDNAVSAYEHAVELEQGANAQTLVALAIVVMGQQGGELSDRSGSLFENALALEPSNPNALFYAGLAAARRGSTDLAADRWEMLLGLEAPPEIHELLQNKVNEWRGVPAQPAEQLSAAVSVNLSVSANVPNAISPDATVFIIARDPSQPSPPIAVTRRRLSELPVQVDLSDRDAMIPGRPLSAFSTIEIVTRISLSGTPAAQSGDWFNSIVIDRSNEQVIDLIIDQIVP